MKLNFCMASLMIGALAVATSGCALFDKSEKYTVQGSDGETVSANAGNTASGDQVLVPPRKGVGKAGDTLKNTGKAVKNKKKKKKGNKQNAVSKEELAGARRDVAELENGTSVQGTPAGTDTPAVSNTLPADFSINGEWTIYSVRDNIITGEERPYITYDLQAKRFYGSNGCNIINGDVVLGPGHELRMDNIIATMKMCADAPFEYLINLAVSDVRSYSARQEGPITFLSLKGADGNEVLVLRRHNMDFLNGAWKITQLNGVAFSPAPGEDDATMTINIPDLKIHGTTGCNIFNGALFIDPDKIDSMQFIDIVTTRMGCPPGSRETEFLLGLEGVETAKRLDKDTIGMYDPEGKEIFRMTRIEYPAEETQE